MAFLDMDLTDQVCGKHELWEINKTVNLSTLAYRLKDLETSVGRQGYGVDVGLKCLFLQFMYDLSDRQLERELRFNIAYKWFCGFTAFHKPGLDARENPNFGSAIKGISESIWGLDLLNLPP